MLEKYLEHGSEKIVGKEIWIYGIGNSTDCLQNGLKRISLNVAGYCVDSEYRGGG